LSLKEAFPLLLINRRLAFHLRSVLRRALGTRGPSPVVCFTVAAGMLSVKAKNADIAVEYAAPHAGSAADTEEQPHWLPLELLADCAGKQYRRQSRTVQSTIDSLRQLRTLGV
jgi:hypothetical protein